MASAPPQVDDTNGDAEFEAEFQRLTAERDGSALPDETKVEDKAAPEGNAPEDKPAPEPAPAKSDDDGTSGKATEGDGTEPPPKVEASDPWEGVPDDVRERIVAIEKERDEARHKAKSDAERVAALSRKIATLTSAPKDAPVKKAEPTEAQKALDAKIAQLKDDYPEVAEPMLELLAAQREELGAVTKKLETVEVDRQQAYIAQQQALLTEVHPDWMEVAQTPDFQAWMDRQPAGIQKLAETYDAQETAVVFNLFKAEKAASADPAPVATTPEKKAADDRRKDQLEGGREVKSRPAPVTSGPPDDFEEAVLYYQAKKDAEMAAAKRR